MERIRERAIRAKRIAEKKMEREDFAGARKVAIKAHQLCPDLENISQVICVCDVHCSAENTSLGGGKDWYGILQVEHSANEKSIKGQYRKLSLLLHPDKNKLAGAEAAFRLIGEAQEVLLDREKRSSFDIIYRRYSQYKVPNNLLQANRSAQQQQQAQPRVPNGTETFWTVCPFCHLRFHYFKDVINSALRCQSCKKPFVAYDASAQLFSPGSNSNQTATYTRVEVSKQGVSTGTSSSRFKRNLGQQMPGAGPFETSGQSTEADRFKETSNFSKAADKTNKGSSGGSIHAKRDAGNRRKKRAAESSAEVGTHGDAMANSRWESDGRQRGSSQANCNVSRDKTAMALPGVSNVTETFWTLCPFCNWKFRHYKDVLNNTLRCQNCKKPFIAYEKNEKSGTDKSGRTDCVAWDKRQRGDNVDGVSGSNASPTIKVIQVPDSDFSDFDQIRKIGCFKAGQIWALYDTLDAMPRLYAVIRKVFSSGLKMQITWLEADLNEEDAGQWLEKDLPLSCGTFTRGASETTEDPLMFSHPISSVKGHDKKSIKIYPKKGETWAVFSNWKMVWKIGPDNHKNYEYEFVEILSDYDDNVGVRVAFLGNLKGFVCIFCQKNGDEVIIPPTELLRFSHSIPSYRLTGDERKGVPRGSFELDPASLPHGISEIPLPKEMTLGTGGGHSPMSDSRSLGGDPDVAVKIKESACPDDLRKHPEPFEIPEPEFFNFDAMRSMDMFQVGQVWALYSDAEGLPKHYGLIKKVDQQSKFKLQIAWLKACSLPNESSKWRNAKMPICCGRFKVTRSCTYHPFVDSSPFSHQLQARTSKANIFEIYPTKGETWALYKNWYVDMRPSDLEHCDYEIAEIIDGDDSHTKVLLLEHVPGYNAVFKAQMSGSSLVTREIPHAELLRFSHQIPSHNLSEEKDGGLRGFKELDIFSLPASLWMKARQQPLGHTFVNC